ncbi:hypothetical protein [Gallaecimonas sp. GXIMD4217]|uniref:hypothetical protein n=1 Tax=Gallaecimonas sp. GXIMD4217 TaxID=3131927 RepID=UPI00311B3451
MEDYTPEYPIKVRFLEDGSEHVFDEEESMLTYLEFFDSEDPEEKAIVTDAKGRLVHLEIWALAIQCLKTKD